LLKPELHSRIHFFLACLIAFLLPFKQLVAPCIILLLLNWILEGDFGNKFSSTRKRWLFVSCLAFYLLHVVGMCWTSNQASGWFDLEVKLSLFIFPILFATRPLSSLRLDRLAVSFVLGCSLASVLILVRAVFLYVYDHENNFFYERFSYFMHPSYFSMYLNLAFVFLLFAAASGKAGNSKGWLLLMPLIVLVVVLLSSKLGLLSLVLIGVAWLCRMMILKKKVLAGLLSLAFLFVGLFVLLRFSPEISGRLTNAVNALSEKHVDKTNPESTAVRLLIWGAAAEVIREHPLIGAGTGDAKDVLLQKYGEEGITGALKNNLNAHNEYIQVTVALGAFGLVLLLLIQVGSLAIGFKEHKPMLVCFVLLTMLNFLPESMLETQAGVIFYAFMGSVLVFSERNGYCLSLPGQSWLEE
jgi:O-antigen ligase